MTLTPDQIMTANTSTLFLELRQYVRMQQGECPYGPEPQQVWHMSLNGDHYGDCDLTIRDCGYAERSALFTRALMHSAINRGIILSLKCLESGWGGEGDVFEATAESSGARAQTFVTDELYKARADSSELALLRVFLLSVTARRILHERP